MKFLYNFCEIYIYCIIINIILHIKLLNFFKFFVPLSLKKSIFFKKVHYFENYEYFSKTFRFEFIFVIYSYVIGFHKGVYISLISMLNFNSV